MTDQTFAHLPAGWSWSRFDEIGSVSLGRQRSPANHSGANMRPYVRAANVTWTGLDLTDVKEMNFDEADFARFRLQPGDVLINEGSGSAAEVGKPAIWRGEIVDCCFQNTLLRVQTKACSPEYVFNYIKLCAKSGQFVPSTQGVNIFHIGREGLARHVIPVPPQAEQRRIVKKIDSLSAKSKHARDRLDHVPRLVERYKQAVLAAAFRGDFTKEWRAENTVHGSAKEPLQAARRRRAALGIKKRNTARAVPDIPLPTTWYWVSPDELATDARQSICIGPFGSNLVKSDYRDRGIPLIFVRNIRSAIFGGDKSVFVDPAKAEELAAHAVGPGDLLITKMGDPPGDVTIYPLTGPRAIITADCIKLSIETSLALPEYARCALSSDLFRKQIDDITKGVAQQKISLEEFRQLAVPLAPLDEQREIVRLIEVAFTWIDRLSAEATSARTLIDRLDQAVLAKAFRGKLVPQDPTDEPATALLERITAARNEAPAKRRRGRPRQAALL